MKDVEAEAIQILEICGTHGTGGPWPGLVRRLLDRIQELRGSRMDPEIVLLAALVAAQEGDRDGVIKHLRHYRDWRRKNGFEPLVSVGGDLLFDVLLGREEKT